MRWKGFGIAAVALVMAAALPMSAFGDNGTPKPTAGGTAAGGPAAGGGTAAGGTTARKASPKGHWFAGAVTSVSSSSVSLDVLLTGPHDTQLNGTNVTVGLTAATKITYGKGHSTIQQGDLIGVTATGLGTAAPAATQIHVRCNCHFVAGTLGSVGNGSFAVNVSRTGPFDTVLKGNAVTFQVTSSTVFVQAGSTAASAITSLKTGDNVAVVFAATGFFKDPHFNWQTATFTAKHVRFNGTLKPAPTNP
jgi:Domain of unknown function (DUF5666)